MRDEQAVLVGLLIRTGKMLLRMTASIGERDGEATDIYARCIFESVVNARKILAASKKRNSLARDFVEAGFIPEEVIRRDLESRMARGLDEEEQQVLDGLKSWAADTEIPTKITGFGVMKARIEAAKLDLKSEIYFWILPSQAVHGTWRNLVEHHLAQHPSSGWSPRFEHSPAVPVVPMAMVEHAWAFVVDYLALDLPVVWKPLQPRASDLRDRISKVHDGLASALEGNPVQDHRSSSQLS
jgi:hypothetical protein